MVLIADKDVQTRDRVVDLLSGTDYQVVKADTVVEVLQDILQREARVVLMGSEFDSQSAKDLVPLLKKVNRNLTIILISNEESLPLLRRFRREGIFYHALKPVTVEDREELLQAVKCAFDSVPEEGGHGGPTARGRE